MDIKKQILVALGLDKEEVALEYQAKLVDGTIIASASPDLEEGISLNIISEDGTQMPIPEGEYETEEGDTFTVEEEGIVATVTKGEPKEEEAEEEEEEIEKEEDKEEMENLEPVDERLPKKIKESTEIEFEIVNKVTEVVKDLMGDLNTKVENLAKEVNTLKGNKENLEKDNAELLSKVEKLEKEPATEPLNTRKFAEVPTLTKGQYQALTKREKLLYNLNKIK